MIKIENGQRKYFDKNGKEIVKDCIIRYPNGREMMVYETTEGELGVDATYVPRNAHGIPIGHRYGPGVPPIYRIPPHTPH